MCFYKDLPFYYFIIEQTEQIVENSCFPKNANYLH